MYCSNCGRELKEDALFCPYCGKSVNSIFFCSNCGGKLEKSEKFCPHCGAKTVMNQGIKSSSVDLLYKLNELKNYLLVKFGLNSTSAVDIPRTNGKIKNKRMEEIIQENFFSFSGRLNRKPFILLNLLVILFGVVVNFIVRMETASFTKNSDLAINLGTLISCIIMMLLQLSLQVRRLHDLNISGWIIIGVWGYEFVFWLFRDTNPEVADFFTFAVHVFMACLLFCSRGTIGDNKYGPDPLQDKK